MNLKIYLTVLFTCSFVGIFFGQSANESTQSSSTTEMTFDEVVFEYGKIAQGEKIKNVFEFTNTGTEPLLITSAKGSCGCTVPEWPTTPIMPGESGEILVVFDSKGKKGKQSKRVTITANTNPVQNFLTIKGEVILEEFSEVQISKTPVIKNEKVEVNDYIVFPNPASDRLEISLKNMNGLPANIEIYHTLGTLMETRLIDELSGRNIHFDVSDFPSGSYSVSIKVENKTRVAKLFTKI